jgi:Flp pilus assembly secretin CpaC
VVVTPNGQTVVIGGLMETQRVDSIRKVPLLGDIPLLGMAFRRTVTMDVKKELMIFLTPFIVSQPGQLKRVTSDEFNRAELTQRAFTPREMDKYLDLPRLEVPQENTQTPRTSRPPASDAKTILRATPVRRATAVRTSADPAPAPTAADPRRRRTNPKGSIN